MRTDKRGKMRQSRVQYGAGGLRRRHGEELVIQAAEAHGERHVLPKSSTPNSKH